MSSYFSARILGPLNGWPKSGAKTQKSKTPAASGTTPIIATMIPVKPLNPTNPSAMRAIPATMRTIRPVLEAIKLAKASIALPESCEGSLVRITGFVVIDPEECVGKRVTQQFSTYIVGSSHDDFNLHHELCKPGDCRFSLLR